MSRDMAVFTTDGTHDHRKVACGMSCAEHYFIMTCGVRGPHRKMECITFCGAYYFIMTRGDHGLAVVVCPAL